MLLLVLLSGCGSSDDLQFPTEYQAVFLDNGQVFFGRLQKTHSNFLMLTNVFYIKHEIDKDQKEPRNLLLKRGIEWHAPEFMRINARHVVIIKPVAPDSRVFQLIVQAHRPAPPAAPPAPPAPPAHPEKGKAPPAHR
jgi:hypothetical protein